MKDSGNIGRIFKELYGRLETAPWIISDQSGQSGDEKVFLFREEGITVVVRFFGTRNRRMTGERDFEGVVNLATERGPVIIRMPDAMAEKAGKAAIKAARIPT